ncbi:PD-(D/E)XK nuclease family protein [Acidiphilium sp. PA]|uniref:PD-(D/E)XK nuclease family protein n=1 Tax=Acidiphilium sp. PA TaxID=2871705 RepID=UPI002242E784|nr:PD-(D/E)XK nuclease family protein [Acidiphilium sp. PA]MCW8308870.1 PD-(D/E)XK nuclease family protein [Acidiphilium sp. PA]
MDDELKSFIEKTSKITKIHVEKTFFDVGMRGYYENPMSDILAFYLNPAEQHHFGDSILKEFLSCCDLNGLDPILIGAPIRERGHIDIFLESKDWALVIENKILHHANNPFGEYERRARDYAGAEKRIHFVILAPYDPKIPNWKWIPTNLFIASLKLFLSSITSHNKWHVLFADFLTSLERILEPMKHNTLTEADFQYLSDNLGKVKQVSDLLEAYYDSIYHMVTPIAKKIFENLDVQIFPDDWTKDGFGNTTCIKPYKDLDHKINVLSPPHPEKMNSAHRFRVQYYIRNRSDTSQRVKETYCADNFKYLDVEDKGTFYSFYRGVNTVDELIKAVSDACLFIKKCHNEFHDGD